MNVGSERNSGFGGTVLFAALALLASCGAGEAFGQTGACCRGDGACLLTDAAGCSVLAGEFLGAGTACAPNICIGACCTADKGCLENNRDACTAASGTFQGAGSTCDLNCPSHLGSGFTCQGQLKEGGAPLTGVVDLEFSLWTAGEGGDQVGATQTLPSVEVVNGLFTVALDFGAEALTGNSRWLEVSVRSPHDPTDTAPFTTLSPRQPLTATPYALKVPGIDGHSLDAADGNPIDAVFVDNDGKVGIGTTAPGANLELVSAPATLRLGNTGGFTGAAVQLFNPNAAIVTDNVGTLSFSRGNFGADGSSRAEIIYGNNVNESLRFSFVSVSGLTSTVERMRITRAGNVGIGTADPPNKLSVVGGADFTGGNVGIGTTAPDNLLHVHKGSAGTIAGNANAPVVVENSTNAYINLLTPDANERGMLFGSPTAGATAGGIIYNAAGTLEGLQFRTGGNSTKMVIDASGGVGIGTTTPVNKLDVEGGAAIGATYSGLSAAPTSGLIVEGNVGIGETAPGVKLSVRGMNAGVAIFNRTGTDGTVIGISNDSVAAGSISVAGATVSYNAFTGSHYAWSDAAHQPGQLVSMTGQNRRYYDRPDAEIMYGIRTTSFANDPACLGAYLGPEESGKEPAADNPLLVAAVGNGEICVIDGENGDIALGDYLISSHFAGCAMKDDPQRFAVGHIVARAAERVEWAKVPADNQGVRRAKISVLFGNFIRMGSVEAMSARMDRLHGELENVRAERDAAIADLKERLARLELPAGRTASANGRDAD